MADANWKGHDERRNAVRVAGQGTLEAVIVDQHGQPVQVLQETQIRNVSSGGIAFTTTSRVDISHQIRIRYIEEESRKTDSVFQIEVVEYDELPNNCYMVHGRLVEGSIPARMVYSW